MTTFVHENVEYLSNTLDNNENVINYNEYAILENNITNNIVNTNNVVDYVFVYPEPLINMNNNTYIDNNDPYLQNVYVNLNITNQYNEGNQGNQDEQQSQQSQQSHQYINDINNLPQNDVINNVIMEEDDLSNMVLPIPTLERSYNEM